VDAVIDGVRAARTDRGEAVNPNDLWFAIESERFFRVPGTELADALAGRGPTFVYLFTWSSPAMGGWLGACHGLEIAFVFGTQGRGELAPFTGSGPAADRLAETMMDAWIAFARTGDPSTAALGQWPAYGPTRPTMVFDEQPALVDAPFDEERAVVAAAVL
jgi:para-nitrobenzyl esterase